MLYIREDMTKESLPYKRFDILIGGFCGIQIVIY